ncbi:extracellular solute-binding protein [Herbiconiux moechotypicola]|uniref:ABC transporter substrate-binding protein n=1 Tax=Herbiconiux moechotypicola TaxID=637393 RepID=A0ABN3DH54_9MICO|nr:extracellular solute-binding protein [Herbiconiux moechotypicola]MCS5729603.1 extracellular solute-binding protein [Herbiconiux moechotypicola]
MKTRARAILSVTAFGAVTALTLTGCSGGGDSASDADTITMLTAAAEGTPGGDVLRSVIADFEAESGITVELEVGGEDVPLVFETAAAAGEAPDIVNINAVRNPLTWIDAGLVVPVTDYLTDWGLADSALPAAIEEWTRDDGQLQGFPYEGYQWPIWYNTALFEEAGVEIPTTTDELIAAAAELRAAGIQPFAIGGNDWSGQKLFLQIAQSYLDADAARAIFSEGGWCASDDAMKGIELFTELRDAGVFVDNAEGLEASSMSAAFMTGDAAMMSAGSWELGNAPAELADSIQFGGLAVPSGGAFDAPTAYQGTANGFWISTNGAEKIDAVQKFITYMYSPEVAAQFVDQAQILTVIDVPADQLGTEVSPLLAQLTSELPTEVAYALQPDRYVPGDITEQQIRQTALAFAPGTSADSICAGLDSIYG